MARAVVVFPARRRLVLLAAPPQPYASPAVNPCAGGGGYEGGSGRLGACCPPVSPTLASVPSGRSLWPRRPSSRRPGGLQVLRLEEVELIRNVKAISPVLLVVLQEEVKFLEKLRDVLLDVRLRLLPADCREEVDEPAS